jgi:hypothetical protein
VAKDTGCRQDTALAAFEPIECDLASAFAHFVHAHHAGGHDRKLLAGVTFPTDSCSLRKVNAARILRELRTEFRAGALGNCQFVEKLLRNTHVRCECTYAFSSIIHVSGAFGKTQVLDVDLLPVLLLSIAEIAAYNCHQPYHPTQTSIDLSIRSA